MPAPAFRPLPHVTATLFAISALTAQAQNAAPAAQPQPGVLPTITVDASADASAEGLTKPYAGGQVARGGRIGILGNQDNMNTPFSINSFTQELIANTQAQSIGDVLMNDPGVRVARGFGNFQQTYFVRGFPVASDDVAYNGLYGLVPRQYMAAELVERVEVFRGASAFLNGAGSGATSGGGLGGLINVVPKRAASEPLTEVTAGIESSQQGYVAADISRRFGPDQSTGIRLNAAGRDGGTGVGDEKAKLGLVSVGLDWHSRNVRLSADFGYQNYELKRSQPSVTLAPGIPVPKAPDAASGFAQPWTFSDERDTFATVRGEVDITDSVTAWAAVGGRQGREFAAFAPPTLTSIDGTTTAYRFENQREDNIATGEVGIRGKFKTGSVGHTVMASGSIFSSDSNVNYGLSNNFANNLYYPYAVPPQTTPFTGSFGESIKNTSFAVGDTMSFWDDRILLTLGARDQKIEDETFGPFGAAYSASKTSPMGGLVVKATKEISVYGNYIEGLVKGDTAQGVNIINQGQVFAPYVAKQKEVGVKYDGGKFGGALSYFTTNKPSAYVQNGVYGVFGEQRNKGVELTVYGEPAKGLRLLGGATFLDAKMIKTPGGLQDGNRVIGVPKQQANIGVDWDVPGVRNLSLNGRVLYTASVYADGANQQQVPSWTRFDIGARYLVDIGNNRLLTLRARIDNLTNKNYWASAGGYPGQGYLTLATPRTFSLTGTINF
ncbi:TonB-dependent receptor [Variovorax rhizosphaerae]|uniref:TonB-dependent receptor n=1 Tax=Variovorax rhizosphaerae TaxID=1836200 RepID=A0ABU8WVY5_9BURK